MTKPNVTSRTMTTEDRKLTAVEWRLYIVALLALIYVVTWRVLARPPALATSAPPVETITAAPATPPAPVRTVAAPPRAVTVRATPAPQTVTPVKRITQRPRIIRMQPVRRVRSRSS